MRYPLIFMALAAILGGVSSATAKPSDNDCAANMVCASNPKSIVDAIQQAGYRAELTKDGVGDPQIDSSASGYKYSVMFYDCTNHMACKSIQFQASFNVAKGLDVDYVNKWNETKRFVRAALEDGDTFYLRYDVSTTGGLTQENFADVLDWWELMLGDYSKFASENLP